MPELRLMRASTIFPIIAGLEVHGAPHEKLLNCAGLSENIAEQPGNLIPQSAAWKFGEIAAKYTGDSLFGYRCIVDYSSSIDGKVIELRQSQAATLFEALKSTVAKINKLTTGTRFWCEHNKDELWILRQPENKDDIENWQVELFAVSVLITAISQHMGHTWIPRKLRFRTQRYLTALPDSWSDAELAFECTATGICIPIIDLVNRSDHARTTNGNFSVHHSSFQDLRVLTPGMLQQAVMPFIINRNNSIRTVADAFGLSERTFQRRLAMHKLTYRKLLGNTRIQYALTLLDKNEISVTELALDLGYQNPGDFARAFRRRVGVSPSQYRNMLARN